MTYDFNELMTSIDSKFRNCNNLFEPYIMHIRFPHYKMLKEDSIIHFTHPFTVLIGPNGTNKTSILQALYGCPQGKSLGAYWFSTDIDKIDDSWKHRVIHGYYNRNVGKVVESLKTRIGFSKGNDYWEPSRPIESLGMEIPTKEELNVGGGKSTTRWDAIKKELTFIDCKNYFSAFDLFFYLSEFAKSSRIPTRQSFLRGRAKHLREVITRNLRSYRFRGVERITKNQVLPREVCEIASYVLGKKYTEIRVIEHSLYDRFSSNKPAKTILIKSEGMEYSEAFAGSGEARVVLIINDIYNAPEKSLILMDEPEISLHPDAIRKLKLFILDEIKRKNQQVVISTHSPTMIEGLPNSSIKVLYTNGDNKIEIKENVSCHEAFFVIGEGESDKKKVIVEDILSKYIIDYFIEKINPNLRNAIEVQFVPGGAQAIVKQDVVSAAREQDYNKFFILDGDQDVLKDYCYDANSIIKLDWIANKVVSSKAISESYNNTLDKVIKELTGQKINFAIDGGEGNNDEQKVVCQRQFLDYWGSNVYFFYEQTPEKAILDELEIDYKEKTPKQYFRELAELEMGSSITSEDIFNLQKRKINELYGKKPESILFRDVDRIINAIVGR